MVFVFNMNEQASINKLSAVTFDIWNTVRG